MGNVGGKYPTSALQKVRGCGHWGIGGGGGMALYIGVQYYTTLLKKCWITEYNTSYTPFVWYVLINKARLAVGLLCNITPHTIPESKKVVSIPKHKSRFINNA